MDLEYVAIKCPCGKNGRFNLYIDNGLKLCLDCMYDWLHAKLVLKIKDENEVLGFLYAKSMLKSQEKN